MIAALYRQHYGSARYPELPAGSAQYASLRMETDTMIVLGSNIGDNVIVEEFSVFNRFGLRVFATQIPADAGMATLMVNSSPPEGYSYLCH